MRVICVKHGERYGAEWVLRLRAMVARHLPCEHEFVCYTERAVAGVTCEPLPSDLPGWWSKIGLLKPGLYGGEKLYFDLDVVARGDLSVFRRPPGKVWALDDFSYGFRKPKFGLDAASLRLLGGPSTCNSSVMHWHGDDARKAWDDFTPAVMDEVHGDQNWITKALWPHTLALYEPRLACSFKYHTLREDDHGVLAVFHGSPKVNELPLQHPLRREWEAA
jgi:hypothetical protein